MPPNKPAVLLISPSDSGGGAELVAKSLFSVYQQRGLRSFLLVGRKNSSNHNIILVDNNSNKNIWFRCWQSVLDSYEQQRLRLPGLGRLIRASRGLGQLPQWYRNYTGLDEFDFPDSVNKVSKLSKECDIIHAHNLHGGYFDLRMLGPLSKRKTLVLSLHDAWLFSGHCAFSLACERWQTGCGLCPDLSLFPAVNKDSTDKNWQTKKAIFDNSEIYLITPSYWLMQQAKRSLLSDAIVESVVIPNGVDTSVFYPRNKQTIRAELGISRDARVLMVAASGLKENQWKDFATLREAIALLTSEQPIVVLAVGDEGAVETIGHAELKFIKFETKPDRLAELYSTADVYVHSSVVEVFGNVLLEARACGIPVVSTAVGGVAEHVNSIDWPGLPHGVEYNEAALDDGVLCEPRNATSFAEAVQLLLNDDRLRQQLSENAIKNMCNNFDINVQVDKTLAWYTRILASKEPAV